MSLFVYDQYNLVTLDKGILKVVKLYFHSIYVLETQKEGCIYKDNMEYNSAQRSKYLYNAFDYSSTFTKSDSVTSGRQYVKLNGRVSLL